MSKRHKQQRLYDSMEIGYLRVSKHEQNATLLRLEFTKTLHTYWLVARLDPLSLAELLNLRFCLKLGD